MSLLAPILWAVLAQPQMIPLRGVVSDAEGRPVTGAEVVLVGVPTWSDPAVVGRARTDGAGTFAIDRPRDLAGKDAYNAPTLWVVPPRGRMVLKRFPGPLPAEAETIRLTTRAGSKTRVRVETPDGEPAAGAKVRALRVHPDFLAIPEAIVEMTGRATDARGLAELDAFAPEDISSLEVQAEGFGRESRGYSPPTLGEKRVALRPVGSVVGRLVADEPVDFRGWKVQMSTQPDSPSTLEFWPMGHGKSAVDAEGRFALPAIAEGRIDFYIEWPDDSPVLPAFADPYKLVAGRENSYEIRVRRGSKVTGVVRERGTGKPIAGTMIWLQRPGESSTTSATTDAMGRYTFLSLAGKGRLTLGTVPPGYVSETLGDRSEIAVPDGARTLEVDPIELGAAAPAVRGFARDEKGRPVSGAKVTGSWSKTEGGHQQSSYFQVVTSDDGSFAIAGAAPGAEVSMTARRRDTATAEPVKVRAGGDGPPVTLELRASDTTALVGRVLGPGDEPVTNAAIKVIRQTRTEMSTQDWGEAQFDDNAIVRTGPDGMYRTPKELERPRREFRVEVAAEGYLPNQSAWAPAGEGDVVRMPDVRLRKAAGVRLVRGLVVDRDGKPVAGAKVFQSGDGPNRTETTTDDAGRFRLNGVYAAPALVFASGEGFRFGGAVTKDASVEIRLARREEPPTRVLKTLAPRLSRAGERKLGLSLLEPTLKPGPLKLPADAGMGGLRGPEAALARLDPERALTMVENRVIPQPGEVVHQAAVAQYEDNPREAIATIEADANPASRAQGFLALAGAEPDRERRLVLIDRALAEGRKVGDTGLKFRLLESAARMLLDDRAIDRATPVLREGQNLLTKPNWSYEGERFAEVLGVIDLPAARDILARKGRTSAGPPDPSQVARHLGELATRVAAIDPNEAERLLGELPQDLYDRDVFVLRASMAMAPKDLARARKLLEAIQKPAPFSDFYDRLTRPYRLGLLASALADSDPKVANALLDESFDRLAKAADKHPESGASAANFLGALLPVVERVAPDRLEERVMLAASLRPPHPEKIDPTNLRPMATLALLIARYDREAAAVVFAPVRGALPELAAGEYGLNVNGGDMVALVAAYDPQVIVELIDGLPESARKVTRNPNGWTNPGVEIPARVRTAELLGLPPAARRREALRSEGLARPVQWER